MRVVDICDVQVMRDLGNRQTRLFMRATAFWRNPNGRVQLILDVPTLDKGLLIE